MKNNNDNNNICTEMNIYNCNNDGFKEDLIIRSQALPGLKKEREKEITDTKSVVNTWKNLFIDLGFYIKLKK